MSPCHGSSHLLLRTGRAVKSQLRVQWLSLVSARRLLFGSPEWSGSHRTAPRPRLRLPPHPSPPCCLVLSCL